MLHPEQKPVAMRRAIIRKYSKHRGTGSGPVFRNCCYSKCLFAGAKPPKVWRLWFWQHLHCKDDASVTEGVGWTSAEPWVRYLWGRRSPEGGEGLPVFINMCSGKASKECMESAKRDLIYSTGSWPHYALYFSIPLWYGSVRESMTFTS